VSPTTQRRTTEIRVGLGTCGVASGGLATRQALVDALNRAGEGLPVKVVGCNGMCHREPLIELVDAEGSGLLYGEVGPAEARELVEAHVTPRGFLRRTAQGLRRLTNRLIYGPSSLDKRLRVDPRSGDARAYLSKQRRVVLENCGRIDPTRIEEARAAGAYEGLRHCLNEWSPDEVLERIAQAGLRGRGGAGFPAAEKWKRARAQPGKHKYLICNADEGDPGAFMDRLLIESDPHRVLEGMAIAAYAIGAPEAYVYVRAEYPLAVERLRSAILAAEGDGLLGEGGLPLRVRILEGAGAFVCGEETAMLASIEGRRGTPRLRPPYPTENGLWGAPTCVNNVETYACVPWILRHGPEAFAAMGTRESKGTKVFALAGKIRRGGLIEVPMGITLREIVEDIGGGVPEGHHLKAIQIGGPSGGCVPASLADTPVDYEALRQAGAMMGSGGLVVLDETDCMVEVARFFLEFTQTESCGKCTFCRIGTKRMLEILERLCGGEGKPADIDALEELAHHVAEASLCGLGQTAPNPVLTTLRYFRDEYEAHAAGRCPAHKCKTLITYTISDRCIGCTLCHQYCPVEAIAARPYEQHEIDTDVCVRCGTCKRICPAEAVDVE